MLSVWVLTNATGHVKTLTRPTLAHTSSASCSPISTKWLDTRASGLAEPEERLWWDVAGWLGDQARFPEAGFHSAH